MAIESLVPTDRSLAAATRLVLDRLAVAGFENIDPPEDGRLEVDCLDGDTSEEWGLVVPESTPMAAFLKIKERATTVRVVVRLRLGHFYLYPGFVVLSRPPDEFEDFQNDPRARQIVLREAFELARAFGAREVVVAGDAASDFLGNEASTWSGLKEVLEEEEVPHEVLLVPRPGAPA
jgi:hypothetical protein